MSSGKTMRLGRLFASAGGRALVVALDHGLVGSLPGIENLPDTLAKVLPGHPDGVVVSAGAMPHLADQIRGRTSVILTIDTFLTSSIPRSSPTGEAHRMLAATEDALVLGADAVKVFMVGGQGDLGGLADNIVRVAQTARACERWGLPLIVEPTLWGNAVEEGRKRDPQLIRHMVRIAFETGADVLKIPYPGPETLRELVGNIPCPILIMGGSKMAKAEDVFEMVREAIDAGARGIVFGQNVWQHSDPAGMVAELAAIVHAS
jgi:DhnA family fructose-bisphosphate aldolase class Ia